MRQKQTHAIQELEQFREQPGNWPDRWLYYRYPCSCGWNTGWVSAQEAALRLIKRHLGQVEKEEAE